MDHFQFDAQAYLKRIGLKTVRRPEAAGLKALHNAQFFSIPFENFDIQLGRGISLEKEALFDKLVRHNRGGYCFELNGLMGMALQHFGFKTRPLLARVHLEAQPSPRTHLLNLVELEEGPWIIDVGFGAGGLRSPLPLSEDIFENGQGFTFRLEQRPPWGWMLLTLDKSEWKDSYSFDLEHVTDQDIALGNFYTSHSPDTHFTQIRTASKPTRNGRISLRNFTFTEIAPGNTSIEEVNDGPEYLDFLAKRFGIELEADYNVLKNV